LYPRIISIRRPISVASVGLVAYSGEVETNESTLFTGLPASIQHRSGRGSHGANLPADTPNRADFHIFVPRAAAALGSVQERDIIVDDIGNRYQVIAAYWNSLGYRLFAELLQV